MKTANAHTRNPQSVVLAPLGPALALSRLAMVREAFRGRRPLLDAMIRARLRDEIYRGRRWVDAVPGVLNDVGEYGELAEGLGDEDWAGYLGTGEDAESGRRKGKDEAWP